MVKTRQAALDLGVQTPGDQVRAETQDEIEERKRKLMRAAQVPGAAQSLGLGVAQGFGGPGAY